MLQLKISSWAASIWGSRDATEINFSREMAGGAKLSDLLREIFRVYPELQKALINPETGGINGQIMVVLNETLIHSPDTETLELKDGDCITLYPIITGG